MKYEITSLNTKKLFAEALKKIILQKSFSKVTVSELMTGLSCENTNMRKVFIFSSAALYSSSVVCVERISAIGTCRVTEAVRPSGIHSSTRSVQPANRLAAHARAAGRSREKGCGKYRFIYAFIHRMYCCL